jgi:DNA-directed RNA polymerase
VGDKDTVDRDSARRGVAPNFVHALDAALAVLVINACAAKGIEIATNHDCFSFLACDADQVNKIVREQFVKMFEEHDVLQEIRDSAEQAGATDLPPVPEKGKLDLRAVLEADYFLS